MKILCTGGAGFIGSHLTDALVALGHEVTVLDNLSTGTEENLELHKIYLEKDDIRSGDFDIFAEEKFDVVYHLAAQINLRESIKNPPLDTDINVFGSVNIINQCIKHGVKKFIFASTGGAIYDPSEALPWTEESAPNPQSPYGLAKLTVEKYLNMLSKLHGLSWAALRYSNVYGPRQNTKGEAGVISIFINQALQGQTLKFFGDGHQTRDYIYVDDVVRANLLALKDEARGVYNVSTNQQHSLHDIVNQLRSKIESSISIEYLPAIPGEIAHTRLSYDLLAHHDWKPQVSLDEGLDRTIEYFKDKL